MSPVLRRLSPLLLAALLGACAMPERASAPVLYDLGPPPPLPSSAEASPAATPLALRVQASPALDSRALLYRLAYADAQQLHAYSQSRWAMTPAELLQQRLREGLAPRFALLPPGEGGPQLLHIELDEFSQRFTTPAHSEGQLRLRATLLQRTTSGGQRIMQREWRLSYPAPSADAAGGVRALRAASDAALAELVQWLERPH